MKDISVGMVVAIGLMVACFLYLYLVTFLTIPETGQEHAKTIVGFLLGVGLSTVINYYWGNSSRNSQGEDNETPN
jgi:putative flippase GtrA